MSRGAALLALLSLLGAPVPPALAAPACEKTLWGCPATDKPKDAAKDAQAKYDQLCARVRRTLRMQSASAARELATQITELAEAVQLLPGQPEGWALLGAAMLELGRYDEAEVALRRAESTAEEAAIAAAAPPGSSPGRPAPARLAALASLDPQLEILVVTGLAFLQALQGDVHGALERSRRLLRQRGPSHRALWRTADLLMALGNLEEATALYERACTLPRGIASTALEVGRACHGLLVALDRGERARARIILRRTVMLDADHRAAEMADIFPPCDRDYYQAVLLAPGCARRAALQAYLREASKQPGVPGSYLRRAEEHLAAENNQSCAAGF